MQLNPATGLALNANATPSHAKIEKASKELENQFARMLIKSMRSTTSGDAFAGGDNTYKDMYDQQLAKELTKGRGLGLAPMIQKQLERSTGQSANGAPGTDAVKPLDFRMPGIDDAAKPMLLPTAPGAMSLTLQPGGQSPIGMPSMGMPSMGMSSMGMTSATMLGALPLASSSSGVSMAALPVQALPALPAVADVGDADCNVDCSSPEAFVQSIWPHAQKAAAELGVPAKALVAQAALETGWGRKLAGRNGVTSNNLFGIKAGGRWNGGAVTAATHEYVGGVRQTENASFRAYGSAADSFKDYAQVLGGARYAAARGTGNDTHRFATALQKAGYATDPSYAAKLTAIANGPTLNRAIANLPDTGNFGADTRIAVAAPASSTQLASAQGIGGNASILASLGMPSYTVPGY